MGGFGSAVLELLAELGIAVPVRCLATPDELMEHGDAGVLQEKVGIDSNGIAEAASMLLSSRA
jgi:1-deoxy-D-xylulose-5-phosphate synthase